jgi:formylglycine-generating enzyme required for sulfatase activity
LLGGIDAAITDLRDELANVNDNPKLRGEVTAVLDLGVRVAKEYGPEGRAGVLTALLDLRSAADNLPIPVLDRELGATRSLKALQNVQARLLMLSDRAIAAARAVNPDADRTTTRDDPVPREWIEEEELRMLEHLDEVFQRMTELEQAGTECDGSSTQTRLIQVYVGAMRIELDFARMHLTINDRTIDFGALLRSTDLMAELTARLAETVQALAGRVAAAVTQVVRAARSSVSGLVAGVGRLGRLVVRRRRAAREAAEKQREEEPTGDPGVIEPQMVEIPPGEFLMGIPEAESQREGTKDLDDNARPQQKVTFRDGFLLARYPVTRGEFAAFVADTQRDMPSVRNIDWQNPGFEQDERHPVVCVSHKDAEDYAEWLSRKTGRHYRLPSEAEWEYAARARMATARFWGDGWNEAPSYAHTQAHGTAPVGSYQPNGFGLFDMLGNVWEWVADYWHENYDGLPKDGSAWTTGGSAAWRVVRGGAWNYDPSSVRAGYRIRLEPDYRNGFVGFRLARTR